MKSRGRALELAALVLYAVAFSVIVFLSNSHDWDQQITTAEVERRSWALNHELPLWSYQFCGGSSRFGDPQSYGLSPLILFSLLFGAFLGVKVMIIFCALLGFYFFRKTLLLLARAGPGGKRLEEPQWSLLATSLGLFYVFGNFYVWNFHVGHPIYLNTYLLWGVVYYTAVGFQRRLTGREFALGAFIAWAMYAGAPYVVSVYLLLPVALFALLAALPGAVWLTSRKKWRAFRELALRFFKASRFHLLGLALGAFKLYGILSYQRQFPRVIHEEARDMNGFLDTLVPQFLPTYHFQFTTGYVPSANRDIWEYSLFNLNSWILLIVLAQVFFLVRKPEFSRPVKAALALTGAYFLLIHVMATGPFAGWAPLSLLNEYLFNSSIRAPMRFMLGPLALIPFLIVLFLKNTSGEKNAWLLGLLPPLLAAGFLNFFTFNEPFLSKEIFDSALRLHDSGLARMTEFEGGDRDLMYQTVLAGRGILNCYQPMVHAAREGLARDTVLPLVDPEGQNHACLEESYFTQNKLFISPACSPRVCLNVSALNLYAPSDEWKLDSLKQKFCRGL